MGGPPGAASLRGFAERTLVCSILRVCVLTAASACLMWAAANASSRVPVPVCLIAFVLASAVFALDVSWFALVATECARSLREDPAAEQCVAALYDVQHVGWPALRAVLAAGRGSPTMRADADACLPGLRLANATFASSIVWRHRVGCAVLGAAAVVYGISAYTSAPPLPAARAMRGGDSVRMRMTLQPNQHACQVC